MSGNGNTEIDPLKGGAPPAKASKGAGVKNFLYNPATGAVLGRTGASWAKITLFYFVFYSCLAGFFAICLLLFFETIPDDAPLQSGMNSLIKNNPGMGFRPMSKVSSTLVHVHTSGKKENNTNLMYSMGNFTESYTVTPTEENKDWFADDCGDQDVIDGKKACKFNMEVWASACNAENMYGYQDAQPCVLLKLNKVYNWMPNLFNATDKDKSDVQKDFDKLLDAKNPYDEAQTEVKHDVDGYSSEGIPVICEGENNGDQDNIRQVQYFPKHGFETKYLPLKGQKGYQGPLVMVKFTDVKKNTMIQVWCKAYAQNIEHDKNDKGGSVRFELLID